MASLNRNGHAVLATAMLCVSAQVAAAHGIVGARFFPATLSTDDPFAGDEAALPTITAFDHATDYDFDYSKTILPGIALGIGAGYSDGQGGSGWNNISLTPMAELIRDPDHEAIVSAGFIWEIGGSGSRSVADRSSSYTPEILFGKGLGDLPDSTAMLRPIGFTGQIGFTIPGSSLQAKTLDWGGALEYSLRYLQSNVHNEGLPQIVAQMTPLVEFALTTPTAGGGTTGTVDPGLLWSGQYIQLGAEAIVPVNRASGRTIGAIGQLHLYIDDILPGSLGKPIFGSAT